MTDLKNTDPSNSCTKKRSPIIDEDFGKDFLSSWNSSKVHNDSLDFDVEAVPRKNKRSFNFDELDDFGFGPDFDKLSSFGIPDLDFSKPLKKTEKANNRSSKDFAQEMQDPHSDKFPFVFDFKGLDAFEPDANMVNGGEKVCKSMTGSAHANSAEHKKDLGIKCNSIINTDALERHETEGMENSDSISTSKSAQVAEVSEAHDSTPLSDTHTQADISHQAQQSIEKKISGIEEKMKQIVTETEQMEQSDETSLYQTKSCANNITLEFVQPSASDNESAKDAFTKVQKELVSSGSLKVNLFNEEGSNNRPHENLQTRNASPVNSFNSKSWQSKCQFESSDNVNKFHEVNQTNIIGGSGSCNEHTNVIEDAQNVYNKDSANKVSYGMKNSCEIEDPTSKHIPSPSNRTMHGMYSRGSKLPSSTPTKGKNMLPIQLKPLNKPERAALDQKSKLLPLSMKMDSIYSCPANAKRDCKINVEGTVERKCSISACDDKANAKVESDVTDCGSADIGSGDRTELVLSHMIDKTTTTQNAKIVSSVMISPQMKTYEGQHFTQKPMKKLKTLSFLNSRLSKLTGNTTSSLIVHRGNLNTLSDGSLTNVVTGSDTTNQCALLNSSLKRKTPEMETDPTSIPMTHMESSSLEKRILEEVFPIDGTDEAPRSEDQEDLRHDTHAVNLTYFTSASGTEMELELPVLIENDGNVERAEALSKELDDICSMLRKKREEAKDLLVRAIVNNNSLLMLDHPMIQSRISFHLLILTISFVILFLPLQWSKIIVGP